MSDSYKSIHPEWELVPDTGGETEMSLDSLRDALAGLRRLATDDAALQSGMRTDTGCTSEKTDGMKSPSNTAGNDESGDALDDIGENDDVAGSAGESEEESEEERRRISPFTILEAMLFTGGPGGRALTAAMAVRSMRGVTVDEIPACVERLNTKYAATGRAFEIVLRGDGYRLSLRSEYVPVRSMFQGRVREARLSQSAVQVLAIVAYRQPVTADEVTAMRGGATAMSILTQLVRRRLVQVERPEGQRTAVYRTTDRFLELFRLETLADLPHTDDF